MTKQVLINLVSGKKVFVGTRSAEVQQRLFELGFEWELDPKKEVKHTDRQFMFLSNSGKRMAATNDFKKFDDKQKPRIDVDVIMQPYMKDYDQGFADGYAKGLADAKASIESLESDC